MPAGSHSHYSFLPALATKNLLSVSTDFSILDTPHKQNPFTMWSLGSCFCHLTFSRLTPCIMYEHPPPFLLPSNILLPGSLSSVYSLLTDILVCRPSLLAMFFGDDKYETAGKQVI